MQSAEKAISAARMAQAEMYCKTELERTLTLYQKAQQSFIAGRFDHAKAFARLAKDLADSTLTLANSRKERAQAEAERTIKYCEQKMTTLLNLLENAETLGLTGEKFDQTKSRFFELERTLLEMIDKHREGRYNEVVEQSSQLLESASLATYELIKLMGETIANDHSMKTKKQIG